MDLRIEIPPNYLPERRYILSLLLTEFLGIDIELVTAQRIGIRITTGDSRELFVVDGLFESTKEEWLTYDSMPHRPLKFWRVPDTDFFPKTIDRSLPVIYGKNPVQPDFLSFSENRIHLGLDIFGSSFFMLTRYEEIVKSERDEHNRFPATASLAYQEGFLNRPIINEYLELLWACLHYLWPQLQRKVRNFRIIPSHDVDSIFDLGLVQSYQIAKLLTADILKFAKFRWAVNNAIEWSKTLFRDRRQLFDTFLWLMEESEAAGVRSVFNFMSGGKTRHDLFVSFFHPLIQERVKLIMARGHEVGFHPSYATAFDSTLWEMEFHRFRDCARGVKIKGGRQHYLRFHVPLTWRFWSDAGLRYDSTLGYADQAGFRCGICYEYPVYDLINREPLSLYERPLVVMERTVIDDDYMGQKDSEGALKTIEKLKYACRQFNGDFTLLWHASRLVDTLERELYKNLIH